MEETFMLLMLTLVMLIGSYLAGNIPLVVNWSEEKLKVVSVFGAGLLVGTALTVIMPEGIRALYNDDSSKSEMFIQEQLNSAAAYVSSSSAAVGAIKFNENNQGISSDLINKSDLHRHTHNDYSQTIGLSLVLGFIFMMLVDQIFSKKADGRPTDKNITATLGLVVHAAADGVALGAAATTSHQDVEIIVFLAIMLHKAPAAFGLVSFLLHEGIDRKRIRKHLGIFSLSAPLLTLMTYFGIGQEQKETLNSFNATGIAMLFSAGTFLYVATVHVLPELTTSHSHSHASSINYNHLEEPTITRATNGNGLKNSELLIMICGVLLPLIITFSHQH